MWKEAFEKSQNIPAKKKTTPHVLKAHHQMQKKSNINQQASLCILCSSKHFLIECPQYNSQTAQQRYSVTKHGLCFNCLRNHRASECRSTRRCLKCGKKHHTTIHKWNPANTENQSEQANLNTSADTSTQSGPSKVLHTAIHPVQTSTTCILLATTQVLIINKAECTMKIRALLDQGSEVTLISERAVQTLRLPRSKSSIPLIGVGEQSSNRTRGLTSFKITSLYDKSEEFQISAHILPKLTSVILSAPITMRPWPYFEGLSLADPQFGSPSAVDLIIGADLYPQIIKEGLRKGPSNTPIAQLTAFGWVISGPVSSESPHLAARSCHITMDSRLYDFLHRLEEISANHEASLSPEDQHCEQHFKDTHAQEAQGWYIVRLPLKKSPHLLGNSNNRASKMMDSLRNRFKSNAKYANAYAKFMKEYEDLQHMKLITEANTEHLHPNFYLPHHGVWRESNTITKLRVVFNGSSRTTSGVSLNDILHT
ncbi:uncharacterized protein LOC105252680 [Camponotus floridanus]|uniref:uncharacterized protein LOC105252680 n=1 Tax=Camponotus floridanus TaxID=104421 RepID=UPI000DC6A32F|nr:uncharacterized protein LOC105252680 [Camponotus floridanus]